MVGWGGVGRGGQAAKNTRFTFQIDSEAGSVLNILLNKTIADIFQIFLNYVMKMIKKIS